MPAPARKKLLTTGTGTPELLRSNDAPALPHTSQMLTAPTLDHHPTVLSRDASRVLSGFPLDRPFAGAIELVLLVGSLLLVLISLLGG